MRVISGSKRGTKLLFIENDLVRPTTDRVKEAVFNIIQFQVRDTRVLDLFAGCGGLGIEALSRGASRAVFVDHGQASMEVLRKNIAKTGFEDRAQCLLTDFEAYLKQTDGVYDLIFLDPPYHQGMAERALAVIAKRQLLSDNGLIVLECDGDEEISIPSFLRVRKQAQYGRVKITVLQRMDIEEG